MPLGELLVTRRETSGGRLGRTIQALRRSNDFEPRMRHMPWGLRSSRAATLRVMSHPPGAILYLQC